MSNSSTAPGAEPLAPIELTSKPNFRGIFSTSMDVVVFVLTLLAVLPLFSLLYMVLYKGLASFRFEMLWLTTPAAGMAGGGFGNAIVGTLALVAIATAVAVPLGILSSVYLTEYARGSKMAQGICFCAKILSGLPSILAGVFIYAVLVRTIGFSVVAGGFALAVLMLPIVILSAEEALLRVPRNIRDASTGLGATTSQTILRVTLPACAPALITGVMLAVARAAGETAPVMFTALFSDYWLTQLTDQPVASLSMLIYNCSSSPFPNMTEIGWSASLILILMVLITNIVSNLVASRK